MAWEVWARKGERVRDENVEGTDPGSARQRKWLAAILVLVAISRVPFVGGGLGARSDAWRVGLSTHCLLSGQGYHLSRKPGYPLTEFVCTPLRALDEQLGGRLLAINCFMLAVTLACVLLFYVIAKRLGVRSLWLLVLTFAFNPLVWQESLGTMGYVFALTWVLAGVYALLRRRMWIAGVLLGCAVGARLTSCLAVIPMGYLVWRNRRRMRDVCAFCLLSGAVGAAWMIPVLCVQGVRILPGADPVPSFLKKWAWVLAYKGIGLNAFLILVAGLVWAHRRIVRVLLKERDRDTIFLLLCVAPVLILCLVKPYFAGYVLPAVPFALIFLDKVLGRKLLYAFCLASVLNGFVVAPGIDRDRHRRTGAIRWVAVAGGDLVHEYARWRLQASADRAIGQMALPRRSALITGERHQAFWFQNRHRLGLEGGLRMIGETPIEFNNTLYDAAGDVYYVYPAWSNFAPEAARLKMAGYRLVILKGEEFQTYMRVPGGEPYD